MNTGGQAKPEGTTVHRNPPSHKTIILPLAGRSDPAPKPAVALKAPAAALWARLWSTPEATQWGDADVGGLTRLVVLLTNPEAWASAPMLAEMRNLEDRYGLNPYGRRVAKWYHAEADRPGPVGVPTPIKRRRPKITA